MNGLMARRRSFCIVTKNLIYKEMTFHILGKKKHYLHFVMTFQILKKKKKKRKKYLQKKPSYYFEQKFNLSFCLFS